MPAGRIPLSRFATLGLLVLSAAATGLLVLREESLTPYQILAVLLVAFGALALVVALKSFRRWLSVPVVLVLSGGLLVGSALAPVKSSNDLWAYAMYGRTIVQHLHPGKAPMVLQFHLHSARNAKVAVRTTAENALVAAHRTNQAARLS